MSGTGNVDALEAALDDLYGVAPTEFVETRKRLAAELRATGDKDMAKVVMAARRPTTAAWALNQLTRTEPELVDVFLARSRELQAAQTGGLAGGREAVRDTTRAQRSALAEITEAAVAALGDRATDAYRTQILSTLHVASADEAVADQLRQGRLVREVSGSTGFPDGPTLTLVPDVQEPGNPVPPKRQQRVAPEPERDDDRAAKVTEQRRLERERAAVEQTRLRLAAAEADARSAQEAAVTAEAAAVETRARVVQLQDDLDGARRDAREADDAAARARREATRLARAATRLRSRE